MTYSKELEIAKDAAREAGEIMQEYQREGFSTDHKSTYTDLVTEADVACQEAIVDIIHSAFPKDGFLAEEEMELPENTSGRRWVVDPIDGTKNFAHGFQYYCTSIALKVDGQSIVGVVYDPTRDELFSAVRGQGAYLNGEQISVSDATALKDSLIIARLTDWNDSEVLQQETAFLHELLQNPAAFRRPGAAALDLCQVAAGRAEGHALVTINEWDIAAGSLIVEEAGGQVRVQEALYGTYLELIASNNHIHSDLAEIFDNNIR